MQKYAEGFYKSKTWQACRNTYVKSKRGLCELCLKQGLMVPGEAVHHIKHITPDNITDPSVTLNPDNLMLLCRDHHAMMHRRTKRYKADKYGRITASVTADDTPLVGID